MSIMLNVFLFVYNVQWKVFKTFNIQLMMVFKTFKHSVDVGVFTLEKHFKNIKIYSAIKWWCKVLVGATSKFLSINPDSSLCFDATLTVGSDAVVNSTVGRIKGNYLSPPGHHKWLGTAPHLD